MRIPGPDHPIRIAPHPARVTVTAGGRRIADSDQALTLTEARYPPVLYLPRADVDMDLLVATATRTHCPYKGEAHYFALPGLGRDIGWSYPEPYPATAAIAGHVAFYPDRVDAIALTPPATAPVLPAGP